jgi:hypothetical protein
MAKSLPKSLDPEMIASMSLEELGGSQTHEQIVQHMASTMMDGAVAGDPTFLKELQSLEIPPEKFEAVILEGIKEALQEAGLRETD